MTEKNYGGAAPFRREGKLGIKEKNKSEIINEKNKNVKKYSDSSDLNIELEKVRKAGEISKEVKKYAREFIKKDMPLLEIAEKIEEEIGKLGGEVAFPTTLSINEIAAHYTPSYDDKRLAGGLLKIDLGVHVDGWISDTAFSIDLEGDDQNIILIKATEKALENAINISKFGTEVSEIGKEIEKTMESFKVNPIVNLTGHGLGRWEIHLEPSIPNIDNKKKGELGEGSYAIEPFATFGSGRVYEGKPSGIYVLNSEANIRNALSRKILKFIKQKYNGLPFCSRNIIKEFGRTSLFALNQLEESGIVYQFPQLIEAMHKPVAQTEHSIIVTKNKTIVIS